MHGPPGLDRLALIRILLGVWWDSTLQLRGLVKECPNRSELDQKGTGLHTESNLRLSEDLLFLLYFDGLTVGQGTQRQRVVAFK